MDITLKSFTTNALEVSGAQLRWIVATSFCIRSQITQRPLKRDFRNIY